MEILNKIENKIINLIDINEKLLQKIQHLSSIELELKKKNASLIEEKNEIHHRLEKLLLTINEVEDVIHSASRHQEESYTTESLALSNHDH